MLVTSQAVHFDLVIKDGEFSKHMNSGHVLVSELTVCRDSVETPAVRHGPVKSGTVSPSRCFHIFLPLPTEKSEIKTQKG